MNKVFSMGDAMGRGPALNEVFRTEFGRIVKELYARREATLKMYIKSLDDAKNYTIAECQGPINNELVWVGKCLDNNKSWQFICFLPAFEGYTSALFKVVEPVS